MANGHGSWGPRLPPPVTRAQYDALRAALVAEQAEAERLRARVEALESRAADNPNLTR